MKHWELLLEKRPLFPVILKQTSKRLSEYTRDLIQHLDANVRRQLAVPLHDEPTKGHFDRRGQTRGKEISRQIGIHG